MQSSILNDLKRDRLFGKDVTNLLELKPIKKELRASQLPRKDQLRGISEDLPKRNVTGQIRTSRLPEPTLRNNTSMRTEKDLAPREPANLQNDVQFVPEYFQQNLRFMLQQEAAREPLPCSLSHQKDLSESMRMILFDWLVDVHLKLRMFPQTLFITCNLIDRYLVKKEVNRSKLQLLGATCLFIAAKYEETYEVPELNDLVNLCAKAFSKEDFTEMEAQVLKALDFDLIVDSPLRFLEPFSRLQNLEPKMHSLCRLLLEMCLFDIKSHKFSGSLLAASSIYLCNRLRKKAECWSDQMIAASGYSESELKSCSSHLMDLLDGLSTHSFAKNLRRKFSMVSHHEVGRQKYERPDC